MKTNNEANIDVAGVSIFFFGERKWKLFVNRNRYN